MKMFETVDYRNRSNAVVFTQEAHDEFRTLAPRAPIPRSVGPLLISWRHVREFQPYLSVGASFGSSGPRRMAPCAP
jgi:hypothetical protein